MRDTRFFRLVIIGVAVVVLVLALCGVARCTTAGASDDTRTCSLAKPGGGSGGGAKGGGARSGSKPKAPPPAPRPVVVIDHDCD
jgi:hypothetical protein